MQNTSFRFQLFKQRLLLPAHVKPHGLRPLFRTFIRIAKNGKNRQILKKHKKSHPGRKNEGSPVAPICARDDIVCMIYSQVDHTSGQ